MTMVKIPPVAASAKLDRRFFFGKVSASFMHETETTEPPAAPPADEHPYAVFRNPDFTRYLIARFVSAFGMLMLLKAVDWDGCVGRKRCCSCNTNLIKGKAATTTKTLRTYSVPSANPNLEPISIDVPAGEHVLVLLIEANGGW